MFFKNEVPCWRQHHPGPTGISDYTRNNYPAIAGIRTGHYKPETDFEVATNDGNVWASISVQGEVESESGPDT